MRFLHDIYVFILKKKKNYSFNQNVCLLVKTELYIYIFKNEIVCNGIKIINN